MSDIDLSAIASKHSLNPHDFGCSCGKWIYRAGIESWDIDIDGHRKHIVEVTAAAVREQVAREIVSLAEDHHAEADKMVPPNLMYGFERWAAEALENAAESIRSKP